MIRCGQRCIEMCMTVEEFEMAVWELEGVVITIRASPHENVEAFDYVHQAYGNMTINQWLRVRIYPRIRNYQVRITDGSGRRPHGGTQLQTVMNTFFNGPSIRR